MMTRNHEKKILSTANSVLSQDLDEPIEILIGEDCSNDNTLRWLLICKVNILPLFVLSLQLLMSALHIISQVGCELVRPI